MGLIGNSISRMCAARITSNGLTYTEAVAVGLFPVSEQAEVRPKCMCTPEVHIRVNIWCTLTVHFQVERCVKRCNETT